MKRMLVAAAVLALMCGTASARTHHSHPAKVVKHKSMTAPRAATSGTVGSTVGMSNRSPAKAQPGGLAGSGGPNAGNQGGAAPGGSAGGGDGGTGK